MSHQDILIITGTLVFCSIFGTIAVILKIHQYTRPPVNLLVRSNRDIELIDYTEPTYPIRTFQRDNCDLNEYLRISDLAPSYESEILPSYHTTDRLFINSIFENIYNFKYILFIILLIFIISIINYFLSRRLKILSRLLIINLIFILILNYIDIIGLDEYILDLCISFLILIFSSYNYKSAKTYYIKKLR